MIVDFYFPHLDGELDELHGRIREFGGLVADLTGYISRGRGVLVGHEALAPMVAAVDERHAALMAEFRSFRRLIAREARALNGADRAGRRRAVGNGPGRCADPGPPGRPARRLPRAPCVQ